LALAAIVAKLPPAEGSALVEIAGFVPILYRQPARNKYKYGTIDNEAD
jgi:hypothetical protein